MIQMLNMGSYRLVLMNNSPFANRFPKCHLVHEQVRIWHSPKVYVYVLVCESLCVSPVLYKEADGTREKKKLSNREPQNKS